VLVVRPSPHRPLDSGFRAFLDVLAHQVVSAIGVAQAYESERRRVEALAELDAAKTAFFHNVSHELRTPLMLVLEPLRVVLDADLSDDQRARLAMAERNGSRLQRLVDALLDTARIESGRLDAQFSPLDARAATSNVLAMFEGAFAAAGLDLRLQLADIGEPVWLDETMWETIVSNLVANALKYCQDGSVTVGLGRRGETMVLEVTDTGIGIAPEELPKVFDRFHRVRGSAGRSAEGTGIGLALVKAMAEMHTGSVTVQSRPGLGSTFTVTMPLGRQHVPVGAAAARPLAGDLARSSSVERPSSTASATAAQKRRMARIASSLPGTR